MTMRALNPKKTTDDIIRFIQASLKTSGKQKLVVGLSGGVDSATAAFLAVRAIGKANIYPVLLPFADTQTEGVKDAHLVTQVLQIPKQHVCEINIAFMVNDFSRSLKIYPKKTAKERIRLGNIMARCRMIVLFDVAKRLDALVLGTENKSEHLLGYYTRFGDEASDIEPLRQLYKTEVFKLARYLGVPEKIIAKPPSAGLWQGQTDEGEFGFTYKEADEALYKIVKLKQKPAQILTQSREGNTFNKVFDWLHKLDFKHKLPFIDSEATE